MTGHDYTLRVTNDTNETRDFSYQALIFKFGVSEEVVQGSPLSAGGVPQVAWLVGTLKRMFKDMVSVDVFFNGSQIL